MRHHGSAAAFDNKLKLLFLLEPLDMQADLEVRNAAPLLNLGGQPVKGCPMLPFDADPSSREPCVVRCTRSCTCPDPHSQHEACFCPRLPYLLQALLEGTGGAQEYDFSPLQMWLTSTRAPQVCVISGPAGSGKSTISAALCWDEEARQRRQKALQKVGWGSRLQMCIGTLPAQQRLVWPVA